MTQGPCANGGTHTQPGVHAEPTCPLLSEGQEWVTAASREPRDTGQGWWMRKSGGTEGHPNPGAGGCGGGGLAARTAICLAVVTEEGRDSGASPASAQGALPSGVREPCTHWGDGSDHPSCRPGPHTAHSSLFPPLPGLPWVSVLLPEPPPRALLWPSSTCPAGASQGLSLGSCLSPRPLQGACECETPVLPASLPPCSRSLPAGPPSLLGRAACVLGHTWRHPASGPRPALPPAFAAVLPMSARLRLRCRPAPVPCPSEVHPASSWDPLLFPALLPSTPF